MAAHVLFVDDDASNLCVWETALGNSYNVLIAEHAMKALALLREFEVAVIVADQRMPAMTGTELLEQVRATYPDTVRILITAYSDLDAAVEAINRGNVRRFLRKPCSLEQLEGEVADAFDLYHLRARVRDMERRLVHTERVYALGVVAAGVARELEDPVTRIKDSIAKTNAELHATADAFSRAPQDRTYIAARLQQAAKHLAAASLGAERLMGMTCSLRLPIDEHSETECVDLSDVLRMSLRIIRSELRRHGDIELDVHPVPLVRGSGTRLGQVILNLLVNAIEAISHLPQGQGLVTIRLTSSGAMVQLEVSDNGPGVCAQRTPFDPFRRSGVPQGPELGLAISGAIIEEAGGAIESTSRAGGGTVFRVSFPAWKAESDAPEARPHASSAPSP